jgi:hypothetical protein
VLVLCDAVEVRVGAEENVTVGNSRGCVARLAEIVHRQNFQLRRVGPKNGGDASSAGDIQPTGGHYYRTPAFSALEPLGPSEFSGLAFHTLSGAWSGVDYENESINDYTRANPLGLSLQPQPVGSGYVAGAAQLETNRGPIGPSRERDADFAADEGRSIDQIDFFFR